MRRHFLPLVALTGAAFAAAAPARAADPAPTPCLGTFITDPGGDQKADPIPLVNVPAAASPTEDNTDIRSVFFNLAKGPDGKDVLTANIVITNLTKDPSAQSLDDGISYRVGFDALDGKYDMVQANNENTTISYRYQEWAPAAPGVPVNRAAFVETTGGFFEGPMGVVSIVMPAEMAKPGVDLTGVFAAVSLTSKREEQVAYTTADRAPDAAADDKDYKTVACPAPTTGAGDPGPVTPDPGPQQPPQQQPQQQQPQEQPREPASAKKKKSACTKKAKQKYRGKKNAKKRLKALKKCKRATKRRS